jgi:hypothetical protein
MSQYFPYICAKAHCATCRDAVGGLRWREEIAKYFRVPHDDINWECPHGFAWDETTPPPMAVPPATVQAVGAVAMDLDQIRKAINDLGSPEWLVMKLTEAETIIGDERNCSSCVKTARCRALQQNIEDWKRLNSLNSPLSTEAPV